MLGVNRLERSQLYVPASNWRMIEKSVSSGADAIVLDLEDAVAFEEKALARGNVIRALNELDFGDRLRIYRINGLDTPFAYRDLIEVLEAAAEHVDLVMLPKTNVPRDVQFLETMIEQIEGARGLAPRIGIEAQIETAQAALNTREIAASSPRLEALIFGSGDFAASANMPLENIGEGDGYDAVYPGDRWHFVRQSIVLAARAKGLRCLDGPFANLGDQAALDRASRIAHGLGFDGKQCIHPKQLETVNAIFSPSEAEVTRAQRIVAALEDAAREGRGALGLDGHMVDTANRRMAQNTLERHARINRRNP